MSTTSTCASCGKGEESGGDLKACTACKEATYCNRDCQIAHRPVHKKACKKRAAELRDEALFGEPPNEHGDCPICFLRLPSMGSGRIYMSCCGKIVCGGCCHADVYDNHGNIIVGKNCPFCRTPPPTSDEEHIERLKKRLEVDDPYAFYMMGGFYAYGRYGVPQDNTKALDFFRKAGKFGYTNIGLAYDNGDCVERDEKMASHYHELAAMEGNVAARQILGLDEYDAGNYDNALKHHMIAVKCGDTESVKEIQQMYMDGHVAKDDYANALRSHQVYINEIKSDQRDKAAAFREDYRYY